MYQSVRRRIPTLTAATIKCLTILRRYQAALSALPREDIAAVIARTLARESRLAWKERLEKNQPSVLLERDALTARIKRLEKLDHEFIRVNRELIAADSGLLGPPQMSAWEAITRLSGPRARRLRESFEAGLELGLLALRPVWLMNPDVASRILPLRGGLFDVVVFDEASQIPVEHAVPALYRAKRVVVSGDEKQMPPTSFFSSRLASDEDELFDPDDDDVVTESARAALEDQWNRREIKDCEDLLTLARTCLPAAMLKIHYRSNFRELIDFSNAAYYGGDLYVPVQNPEHRTKASPPIVVRRINGTYKDQTNRAEAQAVVDVIHDLWRSDLDPTSHARPSLGVVTFNRKQTDLILDLLEQRAEDDREFRQVLSAEGQRRQEGEDMSFFVKNVENVQGDERDIIVFSTTLARDESTAFHRKFGVLGQHRGERRLNVAVTRARDKIILVTSLPVGEISDILATGRPPSIARDYLQAYMDYASRVSDGDLHGARGIAKRCQTTRAFQPR